MSGLHHVLVADDEPHIGRIVKTKLEQGPFSVTLVADGGAVLESLSAHPDTAVVVLDIMMPVMGGLDVLQRIRAEPAWQHVPCLILTAAGQPDQQARALALGATDFMTKPFSPRRLYARVAELAGVPLEPDVTA